MISGVSQSGTVATVERQSQARVEKATPHAAPSTAVVPVTRAETMSGHTARVRPDTSFLMQLLAINAHEPQTRKFRQADPAEGAARYAATPTNLAQTQPRKPRYSGLV